jgi:hypothetical protein
LVGACCQSHLAELATPVYWADKLNLSVPDAQPLWRYMDLAKFASMLGQRGLFFPRLDKLGDPFEGAAGLANREKKWDEHYLDFFRDSIKWGPEMSEPHNLPQDEVEAQARKLLASVKAFGRTASLSFASCWYANDVESEALWRLYCPPMTAGLAILSRASALWEATRNETNVVVGRVHYLDFRHAYASLDQRAFCKRKSLSHEHEVRAVLSGSALSERATEELGHLVPCDLCDLIEQVVVSPFAPEWFEGVLRDIIARFGFAFELHPSELLEQPFF